MEILKSIDFFGSYLHWYVNKQKKLYTILGGILTILCFFVCFTVFASLIKGIIDRNNPTLIIDDQPYTEYQKIKFGQEKIYIPWRIADYSVHKVNFTGWIYPVIYYYYGTKDKETGEMPYNYKILKYKNCNETNIESSNKFSNNVVDLNALYCIDMEDLYMGGDYFNDFIYHIRMELFLCEDGVNYNTPGKKCTNTDELAKVIGENNSWHFEFYYPEILIKSQNKKNPVQIFYSSHFYKFNKLNTKIERLYLKQFSLIDDQGWIFEDIKTTSVWGFDKIDSDTYSRTDGNDIISDLTSSKIYSLVIYLNNNKKIYMRKYPKLLESLGNIITLVYVIFAIFKYISQFFTEAYQDRDIVNNILLQKFITDKKYMRYNRIKKNITNNFNLLTKLNPLDNARLTYLSNSKNGTIQNPFTVNKIMTIENDYENIDPSKQRKSKFSINNENFRKFNNADEPKQFISTKTKPKSIRIYNYDDSSDIKNAENSISNFNNKNQKNTIMSRINNDKKRGSLVMDNSRFYMNNKKTDSKKLDLIRALVKNNNSVSDSNKINNFHSKEYDFPCYLYLLNIFDKTFSIKFCCLNHKFRNAWKNVINMFDVVKFIQLQTNVDLINKIIFEMEIGNEDLKIIKNN